MRKLASIKTVSDIMTIDGRDKIVLAIIDGWSVIVKKGEFNIGDKCVYCEIDSVLPDKPEFEFLRSKKFRIKTMKMAGVISQGICFPLSALPSGEYSTEQDVTEIIGVKQYEATMDRDTQERLQKKRYPAWLMRFKLFRMLFCSKTERKGFPDFISKTDETRIQNMPFILRNKDEWIVTEKVDGQSGTFVLLRKGFGFEYIVCSRNLRLFKKDNSSYWSVSDRYNIPNVLRQMIGNKKWVAIQGECVAPNVQGNKYKVAEPDLYVFNVIYPDGRLGSAEAAEACEHYGLQFVPILKTDYVLPDTVQSVLDYAHGESWLYKTLREGLVFRSKDGKQSFKAVDPLFLLQHDE